MAENVVTFSGRLHDHWQGLGWSPISTYPGPPRMDCAKCGKVGPDVIRFIDKARLLELRLHPACFEQIMAGP